jgi:hypothetical protein
MEMSPKVKWPDQTDEGIAILAGIPDTQSTTGTGRMAKLNSVQSLA